VWVPMGGSSKPMGPHWGTCLQPSWKPEEESRVDSLQSPMAARPKALYDLKVHVRVMPTYAGRVNAIK
jgi:hypothetical protein